MHGGRAPAVKAAAARRLAEARAAKELASVEGFAQPVDVGPAEALLDLVKQSAGMVAWLGALVAGLEVDPHGRSGIEFVGDVEVADPSRLIGRDHLGDQAAHIWLHLWNQERDRLARFSKMAHDAGVAEAQVRITSDLARELVGAIRRVIVLLGIDPGSEQARAAVRSALTGPGFDVEGEVVE